MWNSKVFDGSEPRLALYSSLISHFRIFWKKSKNRCQKGGQKLNFLMKKRSLGAKGSIVSVIFDFLLRSKHNGFFGIDFGRQNLINLA